MRKIGGFDLRNLQLNGQGHSFPTDFAGGVHDAYGQTYENGGALPQIDPIRVIRRRLWIIILLAILFAGLATGASFAQTPTYETSILLLIGQKQNGDAPSNLQSDFTGLQELAATVATASTTEPITKTVAQKLDLKTSELPGSLSAEVIEGTILVQVTYKDTNPKRAQRVANAIGEEVSDRISVVSPGASAITATVWQEASLPQSPVSPDPVRNILLGLLLGLMVGVGLAFLLDRLDDNWGSPEEAETVSGLPTLGAIPTFNIRKLEKERKLK
jgi:capsular polysaccharide biosynthesis protein